MFLQSLISSSFCGKHQIPTVHKENINVYLSPSKSSKPHFFFCQVHSMTRLVYCDASSGSISWHAGRSFITSRGSSSSSSTSVTMRAALGGSIIFRKRTWFMHFFSRWLCHANKFRWERLPDKWWLKGFGYAILKQKSLSLRRFLLLCLFLCGVSFIRGHRKSCRHPSNPLLSSNDLSLDFIWASCHPVIKMIFKTGPCCGPGIVQANNS